MSQDSDVIELQDIATRIWHDLLARPAGPLDLRFVLQPIVATLLALRDGVRDARAFHKPYLFLVFSDPVQRRPLLKEGFRSVAMVMIIALLLDAVYQFIVLETFYPVEAMIVAVTLAFVPYFFVRGPAARIVRWWNNRRAPRTPTERLQP